MTQDTNAEPGVLNTEEPAEEVSAITEEDKLSMVEFLENVRQVLLNHDARLDLIEQVLANVLGLNKEADGTVPDQGNTPEPDGATEAPGTDEPVNPGDGTTPA